MDKIREISNWFGKAVPNPEKQNVNAQTGCHFEEVGEMLDEMVGTTTTSYKLINEARDAVKRLAEHLKANDSELLYEVKDHVKLVDALCDQIVTGVGVGHMWGYLMVSAQTEVNRSNNSKFVDGQPVFNENKKIMKGPEYFKADLAPFVAFPRF